jgi:NAD(P)-dependent dehydrogenase (short-subunit alcohol dehydrogenase family)
MKSIVMTGGTAGLGLAAAERLRREPGVRLLVGARGEAPTGLETRPLDLARLASVRRFADEAGAWLGEASLDALALNAGLQFADTKQRTEDGLETTFAANHLAHYLLLRLLAPRLARGAVVVITTSDLHDPKTNPIAKPQHADAERLARGEVERGGPSGPRSGIRAYAASKLCNVLTARALAASALARERDLSVIAFNPGFTPGTRLTRRQPAAFRILFNALTPVLAALQPMNTVAGGGAFLADLTLGRIAPPAGRLYASQVRRRLTWPEVADMANDDAAVEKLWRDSAGMVGLPVE